MKNTQTFTRLIKSALLLVSLAGFVLLQACSSSNNPAAPATDASGLYTAGAATINGTDVNDVTAIIHNDRLMMFTSTLKVLYDGTIVENADGSFSATVDVYHLGVKLAQTAEMTGSIDNRSQVTGDIIGTGLGNATFTLVFNSIYDRDASLERIVTDSTDPLWIGEGIIGSGDSDIPLIKMDFLTNETLLVGVGGSFSFPSCVSQNGTYSLESQVNIYQLDMALVHGGDCTDSIGYTGFSVVVDSDPATPNTDDELIMVIANGTFSVFGVINK